MKRVLFAMFACLSVFVAHAHRLNVFATASETEITGKVYYPSGSAEGLDVELHDASGKILATVRSNASGAFTFTGQFTLPVVLVAQTADGHRAEFGIDASDHDRSPSKDGAHTAANGDEAIRAIIQHELQPLREQLDEQANRARVRDIIGGIGYILGIFGVIALIRRRSPESS